MPLSIQDTVWKRMAGMLDRNLFHIEIRSHAHVSTS